MKPKDVEIHPACLALPGLPGKAFADLCGSIKAIGLQQPILTGDDGAVIDGKNRLWACLQVGVPPRFTKVTIVGDPVRFVVDLNRHRLRKAGQLALAAARLATAEDGGDRKSEKFSSAKEELIGMTRSDVARAFGISKAAIDRAKYVIEHGVDELVAYLEHGEITLGCAEWAAHATKQEQTLASAVSVEAVRELATAMREKASDGDPALLPVEVIAGAAKLIRRWPKGESYLALIGYLENVVVDLKQRKAA